MQKACFHMREGLEHNTHHFAQFSEVNQKLRELSYLADITQLEEAEMGSEPQKYTI